MSDALKLAEHLEGLDVGPFINGKLDASAAELRRLYDEVESLRNELERERMRLAACGVVALANTPESAARERRMHRDYWSGSLDDVIRIVDQNMALRADAVRYRYLRDSNNYTGKWWTDNVDFKELDDLDAAIDAAMKEAK